MSGGSLEYAFTKISYIVEQIIEELEIVRENTEDGMLSRETDPEKRNLKDYILTMEIAEVMKTLMELMPRLHDLEWWMDSDIGDDTYIRNIFERNEKLKNLIERYEETL